jgi:hypothetical protein
MTASGLDKAVGHPQALSPLPRASSEIHRGAEKEKGYRDKEIDTTPRV